MSDHSESNALSNCVLASIPVQVNVPGTTALGCWSSYFPAALSVIVSLVGATPQSCASAAKTGGYRYFGLADGGLCMIGNSLRYGAAPSSYCSLPYVTTHSMRVLED